MHKLAALVILIAFLLSCNNNQNSRKQEKKTAPPETEIVETVEPMIAPSSFPQLFAYLSHQDARFSPDSFVLFGEQVTEPLPPTALEAEKLQPFKSLLIYNKDSSLALDLYSYNYVIIQSDGESSIEEGGPDTEVGLINRKSSTRQRVFFTGPSIVLYDAVWLDGKRFLLAGGETTENDKIKPIVWLVNITDHSIQTYIHQREITADMQEYIKGKTTLLNKPF